VPELVVLGIVLLPLLPTLPGSVLPGVPGVLVPRLVLLFGVKAGEVLSVPDAEEPPVIPPVVLLLVPLPTVEWDSVPAVPEVPPTPVPPLLVPTPVVPLASLPPPAPAPPPALAACADGLASASNATVAAVAISRLAVIMSVM